MEEKYKEAAHKLARYGCVSIGMVYILIGVMAILALLRLGEARADEQRIIEFLLDLPLGEVLIGSIVGGMIGYILWRFFEAYTDPYNFGNDWKGLAIRAGIALSGLGYGILVYSAIRVLLGEGAMGRRNSSWWFSKCWGGLQVRGWWGRWA